MPQEQELREIIVPSITGGWPCRTTCRQRHTHFRSRESCSSHCAAGCVSTAPHDCRRQMATHCPADAEEAGDSSSTLSSPKRRLQLSLNVVD